MEGYGLAIALQVSESPAQQQRRRSRLQGLIHFVGDNHILLGRQYLGGQNSAMKNVETYRWKYVRKVATKPGQFFSGHKTLIGWWTLNE